MLLMKVLDICLLSSRLIEIYADHPRNVPLRRDGVIGEVKERSMNKNGKMWTTSNQKKTRL